MGMCVYGYMCMGMCIVCIYGYVYVWVCVWVRMDMGVSMGVYACMYVMCVWVFCILGHENQYVLQKGIIAK